MTSDVGQCEYVYYAGYYSHPPEQCEEDAVEGTEYCSRHAYGWDEGWDDFDFDCEHWA